jgi:hypothetical protein
MTNGICRAETLSGKPCIRAALRKGGRCRIHVGQPAMHGHAHSPKKSAAKSHSAKKHSGTKKSAFKVTAKYKAWHKKSPAKSHKKAPAKKSHSAKKHHSPTKKWSGKKKSPMKRTAAYAAYMKKSPGYKR